MKTQAFISVSTLNRFYQWRRQYRHGMTTSQPMHSNGDTLMLKSARKLRLSGEKTSLSLSDLI